ncbi:aminotransferase class III-fold pyridoxal phosphate-dependent enzyme [Sinomicrobium weinanense]|uniref:Aminotransferase class III-fold pyridoxal phosphate-dependent enzyme n=1 Tax=Sinomicrobium weinanense TaxID=2842200 RepID=A0A926Q3Q7_9FLAO|nr:aminotransferase class III-fold pyridoxal phosphate-dependent enzyme [Sinomicrobium weinanense]MBC9796256.1 aminotransferase class III-fold pyridoxal phosphate-dependent enzyme [Sinomicrobium weinanense]MBU3122289.1 aminotransferase class III-fold pyridoxal phosphate-dependent enzyme [Sinomicrobium weinanense]
MNYKTLQIDPGKAGSIASTLYGVHGTATALPGETEFNFRLDTNDGKVYILKISRPGRDMDYLDFQQQILRHVSGSDEEIAVPEVLDDIDGNSIAEIVDDHGEARKVRLLTWVPGRVWSTVNPQSDQLRFSLGETCGKITAKLRDFDHPAAHRTLEWDVAQAGWTETYLDRFNGEEKEVVSFFQQQFRASRQGYGRLRRSVVHNDANDNNIIVSDDLRNPGVVGCIDYGDAVYTRTINDLAITCAYAVMHHNNPLSAALPVVKGYHKSFPLQAEELKYLYMAIGMRLVISVTKSAINKIKEPDNPYLRISEKPAWELLKKWYRTDAEFAHFSFREACGFTAHPREIDFKEWAEEQTFSLQHLFPSVPASSVCPVDLSVSSRWLGHEQDFNDPAFFRFRLDKLQQEHPESLIAGGYLEPRPFYTSSMYERTGNHGRESRTIHLGIDIWLPSRTPVHCFMEGEVFTSVMDTGEKGYGGLIILKHGAGDLEFYTLYGHLSEESVRNKRKGDRLSPGDRIGLLGDFGENGDWVPHLHFQVLLSTLGYKDDFPGVTYHSEVSVWKSLCPDPNLLFKSEPLNYKAEIPDGEIIAYRKKHLGKSLSLQYKTPVKMVRGAGQYLMDQYGKKYLDTVNNVAHVGHEHPEVVKAGREQMALINTNSRYLHEGINALAGELLKTLPPELSVLHFVNSGSEANELAIRMIKSVTGSRDIIVSESGYHGNSNMCIDISSYKFDGKGGKGAPEHTHVFPLPDSFRGKYRGEGAGTAYAGEVKKLIREISDKGRKTGGFIVEPIISCGGQIVLPEGFLKQAYADVREAGGLCISDEVQVGCGRVGKAFWGFQLYDVVPDIVTIGKPLGNGHPLAAVACTQEVAEKFANGMEYFNTFGGNPVSCAIGTAVLRVVREEHLQQNALIVGDFLKTELQQLAGDHPIIGDVRGEGLFLGIEFVDRKMQPLAAQADYVINRMKDHGILMSTDGPDNNVLKIKPPVVFAKTDAEELIFYLKKILAEDFMRTY